MCLSMFLPSFIKTHSSLPLQESEVVISLKSSPAFSIGSHFAQLQMIQLSQERYSRGFVYKLFTSIKYRKVILTIQI